jgi:hypothetical protein
VEAQGRLEPGGFAAGRALAALLGSAHPGDPATFLPVIGVWVVTAAAGCVPPALGTLRLDPVAAIRAD